ncbi:hypothetical protein BX666DRAFT_1359790 [Dichotomocladium elegans]|nr:hypothetical protein BX666DRAFT_1359790 [Dichotomocladium elegans]
MDLKPSERAVITKTGSNEERLSKATAPNRKSYRCYKDAEKEEFFFLVYEKGMSVRAAALQLQIKQYWVQLDQKEPTDQITKNARGGQPTGRPPN